MSKKVEIFGRMCETSRRGHVIEHEFGENQIRYAVFTSAKDFMYEIRHMYDRGIRGIMEDDDAGVFIYYTDGTYWNSRDGTLEGYRDTGIYSAVYDSGWFGYYYYNAVPWLEKDDFLEIHHCEPKDPKRPEETFTIDASAESQPEPAETVTVEWTPGAYGQQVLF